MKQVVISGTGLFTPPHSISNEELVVAFNAYMIGPTGNNMPALTEKAQRKLELIEARNLAVMEMEAPQNQRHLARAQKFGSRNLSEEEGGNMEYSRRRHRYLGEYVHVDVSGEFSAFGKWSVSLIYFAFWVFLR